MSGVEEGDLIVRREGAAGVIRLNRPKAINAVTLQMFRDIDKALDEFESDPAVGVILLEGAGERDSSQVPPTSGKKPRPTSGIASLVRSVTTRWRPWADRPTPPSRRTITSGSLSGAFIAPPRSACATRSAA